MSSKSIIVLAALALLVGMTATGAPADAERFAFLNAEPFTIQLQSRLFLPEEGIDPELAAQALALDANSSMHVLVQLDEVPSAELKQDLAERGLELLSWVPDRAWFAALRGSIELNSVEFPEVRWAGLIEPADKLSSRLLDAEFEDFAIDDLNRTHVVAMFQQDVAFDDALLIAEGYGEVVGQADAINALVVALDQADLDALAQEDALLWLDQVAPEWGEYNNSSRSAVGAESVWVAPYNLKGSGVKVFIYDAGLVDSTHDDFGSRVTQGESSAASKTHPTHVAGTVAGAGTRSGGTYAGMAPEATIYSRVFGGSFPFFYNNPGDLQADYTAGLGANTHVSNNSIGSNIAANGNSCAWEGDYESSAALIDAIVRGSLGREYSIVWAAGNERGNGRCGTTYNTIPVPAVNKNAVVVGALNSNDDSMTSFSSWGPTDDGRMRPDISAPGCQSSSDYGVTSTVPTDSYTVMCGTSMASPAVTGLVALILQANASVNPTIPLPSTIKALLAHSATDLGNPGPDYKFGYGKTVALYPVTNVLNDNFVEAGISQAGTWMIPIYREAGQSMRVTVAWDDFPGTPNTVPNLVNNLDLTVIGPDGTTYYPWKLNPSSPSSNATVGVNTIDNIEQVLFTAGSTGWYLAKVTGTTVPQGPQQFSVVAPYAGSASCDADNDGHLSEICGGDDCDDEEPAAYPGNAEDCDDGIDNDCNGLTDGDDPACQGDDDDDDDDDTDDDDDDVDDDDVDDDDDDDDDVDNSDDDSSGGGNNCGC